VTCASARIVASLNAKGLKLGVFDAFLFDGLGVRFTGESGSTGSGTAGCLK